MRCWKCTAASRSDMVFSSITFLFAFLPATLLGYYVLPRRWRLAFLLLASLVFYAWGEPVYVLLMMGAILINWVIGLLMARFPRRKKLLLVLAVALDLSMLGVFKYASFLLDTAAALLPSLAGAADLDIRLPIGISFFTFQILSYIVDVYRGVASTQRNLVRFGAYVTMFPQLIAGPIVRYVDIEAQLDEQRLSVDRFAKGIRQFIVGLSKKLLLANAAGTLWTTLSAAPEQNGILGSWAGVLAYAFQIYFDFSGYSDMACGLGEMLGFAFVRNFRYPYLATSITDFWRRWHISLSTWFREYVYIPLGGNRKGLLRQIRNIFLVWLLTGLWHGASWNFVLWGLYFGVLLTAEKLFLLRAFERTPVVVRRLYALFCVALGWGIFAFTDFAQMGTFLRSLFVPGAAGLISAEALAWTAGFAPWLCVCALASMPLGARVAARLEGRRWFGALSVAVPVALFVLCAAALASQSYNPFIYFRF